MTRPYPYTPADIELAVNAYHWAGPNSCGPDNCPGAGVCTYAKHLSPEGFTAVLDALAAAGWHSRPLDARGNRPDGCGHCTLVLTVNGYVVSEQQLEDRIARVLDDLRRKGRA